MQNIKLNNGLMMPQLGLGVWTIPNDKVVKNIITAVENGYRLFDTAARYENERGVGEAIRTCGISREEIFVTSKLSYDDLGYDATLKGFDSSLKKLGMDYIDLYLIHFPVPDKKLTIESWKALEHIYKNEGRAKAIGVSNFKTGHLEALMQESNTVPAINQIELHPTFTQEEIRKYAKEHNIIVESWSPLGGVANTQFRSKDAANSPKILELPILAKLSEKYGKTPAQIVLRWHIELGLVVIPRSKSVEHIKANSHIFDFQLTAAEVAEISGLKAGYRLGPDTNLWND
ncbi:MAG: aldo/keto reductase [Draconibacterium sp.]